MNPNPLQQRYVDPDLLDALANSDIPSHLADRLSSVLNDLLKKGLDISLLEGKLTAKLLESNQAEEESIEHIKRADHER